MDALERWRALLDEERQAALTADVDTLELLQDRKRALLDVARAADPAALAALAPRARANVALMRQLVATQRALLGLEPGLASYRPDGQPEVPAAPRTSRGVL
ncbi:MAG: hypothetical protein ACFCGT_07325 [Sandaracinaceae bacterium]